MSNAFKIWQINRNGDRIVIILPYSNIETCCNLSRIKLSIGNNKIRVGIIAFVILVLHSIVVIKYIPFAVIRPLAFSMFVIVMPVSANKSITLFQT